MVVRQASTVTPYVGPSSPACACLCVLVRFICTSLAPSRGHLAIFTPARHPLVWSCCMKALSVRPQVQVLFHRTVLSAVVAEIPTCSVLVEFLGVLVCTSINLLSVVFTSSLPTLSANLLHRGPAISRLTSDLFVCTQPKPPSFLSTSETCCYIHICFTVHKTLYPTC